MHYEFVAIPDEQVPQAADPLFGHLVSTYASETNKTAGVWRAVSGSSDTDVNYMMTVVRDAA